MSKHTPSVCEPLCAGDERANVMHCNAIWKLTWTSNGFGAMVQRTHRAHDCNGRTLLMHQLTDIDCIWFVCRMWQLNQSQKTTSKLWRLAANKFAIYLRKANESDFVARCVWMWIEMRRWQSSIKWDQASQFSLFFQHIFALVMLMHWLGRRRIRVISCK